MIENLINSNSEVECQTKMLELKIDILEKFAFYEMNNSRFKVAIKIYREVLDLRKQNNFLHKLISPSVYLGILYRKIGDYNRAIFYLTEALSSA